MSLRTALPTEAEAMVFPSPEQYQKLKQKILKDGIEKANIDHLTARERFLNRQYNYAYQRVIVNKPWPTTDDPLYDKGMVAEAEWMFRRWKKLNEPDLPEPKIHTYEQIAHVAACVRLGKLYMEHGERRRRAMRDGLPVPPPLPLIVTDHMTGAEIEAETQNLKLIIEGYKEPNQSAWERETSQNQRPRFNGTFDMPPPPKPR